MTEVVSGNLKFSGNDADGESTDAAVGDVAEFSAGSYGNFAPG